MNAGVENPVVERVEVLNDAGLHARPAAILAERAKTFTSAIALVLVEAPAASGGEPGTRVDAKSVMDVLFLAAPKGTRIDVEATGADAREAVDAIADLFRRRFGVS